MSKDLEQQLEPNLPFLRKWVKIYTQTYGETETSVELEKIVRYAVYMKDRVEQLELYNECFQKLLEEKDKKCQTKKS